MIDNMESSQPLYSEVRIPKELSQFLRQETYSLLIKGNTGTGKTTLALSILKELDVNKNCLYISTRVSPDQLFQYYPWIEHFFPQSKRMELTETAEIEKDQHIFVDARLDEPGSLFERITNELMDTKAPTIVIDAWDAIGFLMDKEALLNNAKVLQTWRERARAKLIFVTENPQDNTLDFLVDGIVELRQRHYNERLVREIFLSKLRGIRINRPLYTFSLNYGYFHSYDHYTPSEFFNLDYFFTPKHTDKNFIKDSHISTGYHELDEILRGGFPLGCTVSIELDPHVNSKIALAFLGKILLNFMSNQNAILFQPFEESNLEVLMKSLKSLGLKKELISTVPASPPSKTAGSNARMAEQIQQEMEKIKKKDQKKMLLSILAADTLKSILNEEQNKTGHAIISKIKTNSELTIFISRRRSDERHTFVSEISDIRLSILEIDGTMFLQSETPWSHLYAIVVQPEREHGIRLEPMV
ncbi:MAG TPA: ATPase domain-containing protein [Candidatus Nitrosotalea sp.]|nr:ATPase domain-containing protein [Candidatus Nitrosotalea sp.]